MQRFHFHLLVGFLTLAGCSVFGSEEEATLSLRFTSQSAGREHVDFRIAFNDGRHEQSLERTDFGQVNDVQFDAGPFDLATSGALLVACSLLDDAGESFATEDVVLPLRSDWRYDVECSVGRFNPYRVCFGCSGFESTLLGPELGFAEGDSLFVVWGGTSIDSPVLY